MLLSGWRRILCLFFLFVRSFLSYGECGVSIPFSKSWRLTVTGWMSMVWLVRLVHQVCEVRLDEVG